jgi:hypothetical protein
MPNWNEIPIKIRTPLSRSLSPPLLLIEFWWRHVVEILSYISANPHTKFKKTLLSRWREMSYYGGNTMWYHKIKYKSYTQYIYIYIYFSRLCHLQKLQLTVFIVFFPTVTFYLTESTLTLTSDDGIICWNIYIFSITHVYIIWWCHLVFPR